MTDRVSSALAIGGGKIVCGKCGHDFGPSDGDWKDGAVVRERPMNNAGGNAYKSRDHVLLRLFFCPGCGRQLATETAISGEPHLEDRLRTN
jgi:N-methylhydantoinase B